MRKRGARPHPNSGAGEIKEDGSDEHCLYQVKTTKKSFSLSVKELRATLIRALRQGKMPVWLIYFSDGDITLECKVIPGGRELAEPK